MADVAARRLIPDRRRDGVAVVLDEVNHRQLGHGGGVQRLPELALRGGAFAGGDQGDLVGPVLYILELAIIARNFRCGFGMVVEVAACLGAADGLQNLAAGGRGAGEDVELAAGPVRRHLASAGGRIAGGADGLQEHGFRSDAQGQGQGAVAIVGEEPVVAGTQVGGGGHQQGFMSRAGDLEVDLLLALEQYLAVVDAPRKHHQPVHLHQLLRSQPLVGFDHRSGWLTLYGFRRHSHPSMKLSPTFASKCTTQMWATRGGPNGWPCPTPSSYCKRQQACTRNLHSPVYCD